MLGSIGVSGKMLMPMKAALTWGHPMMSPPLTSTRTNALQMRATVEGGGSGCDDGPGQPKQGPGYRETRATVKEGGRRRMLRWSCRD